MNAIMKMTWIDLKLFSRNGIEMFFTAVFPILNILLFGAMYGSSPVTGGSGRGWIDLMIPGYVATLVVGTTAFMNLPLEIAARRQLGVLRRMRATPLQPLVVIGSQVVVSILVAFLSTGLILLTGVLVFKASLPTDGLGFAVGILACCLSLYALTMTFSCLIRSVTATRAVFMAVFFPMMFLSGGTLPMQFMPEIIQKIAQFLPLTYAVNLLKGLYVGNGWDVTACLVLGGILVLGTFLAVRLFRWE